MITEIQDAIMRGKYREVMVLIGENDQFNHIKLELLYNMGEYVTCINSADTTFIQAYPSSDIVNLVKDRKIRIKISERISAINSLIKMKKFEEANVIKQNLMDLFPHRALSSISGINIVEDDYLLMPHIIVIRLYIMLGQYAYSQNNDIEAIGYYSLGYELAKKYGNLYFQMQSSYRLSICYGFTGNLHLAEEKNNEAFQVALEFDNRQIIAYLLGWRATWLFIKFQLNEMYDVLIKIKNMEDEITDTQPVIFAHIYLAHINNLRGELDTASNYISTSLKMIEKVDNKEYLPLALFYLGIIERSQKRSQDSVNNFKRAIEIRTKEVEQNVQNIISLGNIHYQLFLSYMDLNELEQAKVEIENINQLFHTSGNEYLNLMGILAQSIYNKEIGTLVSKVKAVESLKEIMNDSIFEQGRFISIHALFVLYELLFDEFIITKNEETLMESNAILGKMSEYVENHGLLILQGEILLLKAKFSLMIDDFNQCRLDLEKVNKLASEKKFELLKSKAKDLEYELNEKISKISTMIDANKSLFEKVKYKDLKDYLDSLSDYMKRG